MYLNRFHWANRNVSAYFDRGKPLIIITKFENVKLRKLVLPKPTTMTKN